MFKSLFPRTVKVESYILFFFTTFVRTVVCFGIIKPLRSILGFSGNFIFAFSISVYVTQLNFLTNLPLKNTAFSPAIFLKEVVLGITFGIVISLLFEIFPFIGRMIDTFRGNQFSEQVAPELGVRDSVLEIYTSLAMPALFFNGPYYLKFMELYSKYSACELLVNVDCKNQGGLFQNLNFIYFLSSGILELTIMLIFPLILIALSLELALAVFQKLYAKFQIGVELGLLRAGLGIVFLFLLVRFNQPLFYLDKFLIKLSKLI